jgi:hypothetical protein
MPKNPYLFSGFGRNSLLSVTGNFETRTGNYLAGTGNFRYWFSLERFTPCLASQAVRRDTFERILRGLWRVALTPIFPPEQRTSQLLY